MDDVSWPGDRIKVPGNWRKGVGKGNKKLINVEAGDGHM